MKAAVLSYGAAELKRNESSNMFRGLAISVTIHTILLGAYLLIGPETVGTLKLIGPLRDPLAPQVRGVEIQSTPVPPSIGPRPSSGPSRLAIPVPVPIAAVDTTSVDSIGVGGSTGPVGDPGFNEGEGGSGPIAGGDTPGDSEEVFEWVEKMPEIIVADAPAYPEIAAKVGLEGRVVVKVLVDRSGRVKEASVESSTLDILNDASVAAARNFVFRPAIMNDHTVQVWVHLPFKFALH
jgi:periplasmic protein TonB